MIKKNEIYTVTAVDDGFGGEGIAKIDNFTVFVPYLIKGETAEIKILKVLSTHAFGKIEKLITKSEHRAEPKCPAFFKCGGCNFLHLSYEKQLEIKKNQVAECMKKYCKVPVEVADCIGAENPYNYRNKAQYPFENETYGFYATRSHRLVPINSCLMQNEKDEGILKVVSQYIKKSKAPIRHLYTRHSRENTMVVLVSKTAKLPFTNVLTKELLSVCPEIKSIIVNVNSKDTNVILGEKNITIYGTDTIEGYIGKTKFNISPHSFFQVNSKQTEVLYNKAGELLGENCGHIADLYCGIGSIGLYLADKAEKITGVEIVESAVKDAQINAKLNGIENARYILGASEDILPTLIKNGEKIDAVILDPPRKGCHKALLDCLLDTEIEKIVYISCNPATLARDLDILSEKYTISTVTPVDMFPNTQHVESVVALSRKIPDDIIEIEIDLDELDITTAERKATYEEIKEYVFDKYNFKVSSLYIAQIKGKYGIKETENYNISKKGTRVPKCPPDKENAITEALKYYGMI